MNRDLLDDERLSEALSGLSGWEARDAKLHKTFAFADFVAAFSWMTRVADEAERLCHHPDWSNVYNRVEVSLWTHDRGGITALDLALARFMNEAFEA